MSLPAWGTPRHLLTGAAAIACVVLLSVSTFLVQEHVKTVDEELAHTALYARLLEQQVGNLFDDNDSALQALMPVLRDASLSARTGVLDKRMSAVLADTFRARPLVRSVSLVTENGAVVASSVPGNAGVRVDLSLLAPLPMPDQKLKMAVVPLAGRDLSGLTPTEGTTSTVLPLTLAYEQGDGTRLYLVQLISLDYLVNQFERMLGDALATATLMSLEGRALISTDPSMKPGRPLKSLKVFSAFFPRYEAGRYQQTLPVGSEVLHAFGTLRRWPLMVLVERPGTVVWANLRGKALSALVLTALLLGLLATATVLALRSLRRHQALAHRLDQINRAKALGDARSQAVLDSSLDAILTIDESSRIVAFNPAAERTFGYLAQDVMGQEMAQLIVLPDLKQVHEQGMHQHAAREGGVINQRRVVQAQRANGEVFPVEISIVPVQLGEALFFTATLHDITDRQRAEEALLRREEENATLLAHSQQLVRDLETQKFALDQHAIVSINDPQGLITYANPKLLDVLGYQADEMLGRALYEFREPSMAQEAYADMRNCQAERLVWHGELAMRHRLDGVRWFASTIVPVCDAQGQLREYITLQTDITARREVELALESAHRRELKIGSRIQESLLITPTTHPIDGLRMASFTQSARGINGDFYEVIRVGAHAVDVIVGDVMGKGIPAALLGAATKMQLSRSLAYLLTRKDPAQPLPEPKDIVTSVNRMMAPHLQTLEAFVTMAYLRIDVNANTVTWVGCGHEETLLLTREGQRRSLGNQHPPIGLLEAEVFVQGQCELAPGDALFLCSDGASDAELASGGRLGRERVDDAIAQQTLVHASPSMALHRLRRELLSDARASDDLMLILLSRHAAEPGVARLEMPVSLEALPSLRDFVASQAQAADLPEVRSAVLVVAAVEVVTNVIRHAEGLLPEAPIELVTEKTDDGLLLNFSYLGDPFLPPQEPEASDLSSFPEGGFGLYIIHQVCNEVSYLHHEGVNTVRLKLLRDA